MTLIVTLTVSGSIFAQNSDSHWPGFDYHAFDLQGSLYASIMINGQPVDVNYPNWDQMEVAAFVGDELRMSGMYLTDEYLEYGELFPTLNGEPVYYNNPGEVVSFMMFNHATSDLYELCETVIWEGDPITIKTGEEHWEGVDDPEHPLMLNFIGEASAITKVINPNQWYLISTPSTLNPSNVENMLENSYDLYYFDQKGDSEGKEWINRKFSDTEINGFDLELGHGYLYANSGDGEGETYTLTYPSEGAYAEASLDVDLDYFTSNADETMWGWNLVGNPYNATATLNKAFYVLLGTGKFDPRTANGTVEPLEGVLVKADATNQSVTIAMGEGKKSSMLALNLTDGGNLVDRAIVDFGQGSNLPKFQFNNSSKVYFPMEGKEYAIVRSEGMGEMPVSFKAESNGTYNLSLSSENVEFSYLHLIDNLTGADQDLLANPSYSFSANTTDYASRFRLVFATGNNEDNFAFFSNGSLFVNNEGNATLQVVDVTGRIIMSENINGSANVNIDAAPGVYMVRLVNGDNMKVQKVVK